MDERTSMVKNAPKVFRRGPLEVRVGDCISMPNPRAGDPPFIAQVLKLLRKGKKEHVLCRWFYRARDLPSPAKTTKKLKLGSNEVRAGARRCAPSRALRRSDHGAHLLHRRRRRRHL